MDPILDEIGDSFPLKHTRPLRIGPEGESFWPVTWKALVRWALDLG